MKSQIAFIDEYGNFGFDFDKEGVSTHFIMTSIIVDIENIQMNEAILEIIREKEFQTREIKSSLVGKDLKRRLKILKEFQNVDFHIFSVVVDKRKLTGEGFKFKQPFYKFSHSLVDRELFKVFPDLKIVADEHGSKEFMTGFVKYIEKNHIPNLFNQSDFRFPPLSVASRPTCFSPLPAEISNEASYLIANPIAKHLYLLLSNDRSLNSNHS